MKLTIHSQITGRPSDLQCKLETRIIVVWFPWALKKWIWRSYYYYDGHIMTTHWNDPDHRHCMSGLVFVSGSTVLQRHQGPCLAPSGATIYSWSLGLSRPGSPIVQFIADIGPWDGGSDMYQWFSSIQALTPRSVFCRHKVYLCTTKTPSVNIHFIPGNEVWVHSC